MLVLPRAMALFYNHWPLGMTSTDTLSNQRIDEFIARSRCLNGHEIVERAAWNRYASIDAIRHYAYGTSDDNPLWLDRDYAVASHQGGLLAPPAFVCSVLYPFLHGEPMDVPLSSLIGKVEMTWFQPIRLADELTASARQRDVTEAWDRRGRRLVYIDAETTYRNQHGDIVATALGTMVRVARGADDLMIEREVSSYSDAERDAIHRAIIAETRAGVHGPDGAAVWVGQCLPVFVRGPLTIGDLVCWQAAIGPSYRAGNLGYLDLIKSPQNAAVNPVTGWPVKYSQQHEDFLMAKQRGMPAPFDNSLMRFAWLAPMLTNWMGDRGFLKRLSVRTDAPNLYGDTTWYRGIVTAVQPDSVADHVIVSIKITGINQLGQVTTSGEAEVSLPRRNPCDQACLESVAHTPDGESGSVLDMIRRQVDARPDSIAVQCGDDELTYAELGEHTDRVARALARLGVCRGTRVALMLERNLDAIIVILAVLKSGGAYIPVDSSIPLERQRRLLAGAATTLLLAPASRYRTSLDIVPRDCKVVAIESLAGEVDGTTPLPGPASDGIAYVMPTSGTLAAPRLSAVSHASLARYLRALRVPLGVCAADAYLHSGSFSFSASVRQLFLPLSLGARLVLADAEQRLDPLALAKLMQDRAVTIWDTVPSVWQSVLDNFLLLSEAQRSEIASNSLRLIMTTGEPLSWNTPRTWRNRLGHRAEFINLYSQTETAGTVCTYPLPEELPDAEGFVPLGRPIEYTEVLLLDDKLRPVASGEVGEICVASSRLASGYLGESKLTEERFPLRPFHHEGFYRTGDLARQRADGVLEYAGRVDHRVKIRGQRVELGEIEEALRTLPGVAEAAVVLDKSGDEPRLVGYLACQGGMAPETLEILVHLRKLLPEVSLPSVFVSLERLPRNAAGKVDRPALPLPARGARTDAPVATDHDPGIAATVERLFAEALGLPRVDHEASFFDLGGNSLMATQVITRLRAAFETPLAVSGFFEQPSVAAVACAIEDSLMREIEALTDAQASRQFADDGGV